MQGVSGFGNSDRGCVPSLLVCVHRCVHLVSVHFLKSELGIDITFLTNLVTWYTSIANKMF